jgi:cell division ATPase FtsA
MSSSKKGKEPTPFIVFDIGSASIGAALVAFDKDTDKINVLYDTRVFIAFQNRFFKDRHLTVATMSALKKAVKNIQDKGVSKLSNDKTKNIKDVFCILGSPWYEAEIRNVKSTDEKPFAVSPKFIAKILDEESKKFEESKGKLVERNIIQISLNGYSTDNPYDKEASAIDTTLFFSTASSDFQDKIRDILETEFTASDISFNTFALASFSAVRDIFKTEENFLLLDISGETTDIMLVRDETIKKLTSFKLGKNFLIRKVASSLNTVHEEAHSLIRLFIDGKSKDRESAKMESILNEAREEWLFYLRKTLADFSEGFSLPKTVLLTVDTDLSKWFINTIKNDEFSSHTLAEEPFTVVELSSRILHEYCTMPKDSLKGCDPFLALGALFVHKIANE